MYPINCTCSLEEYVFSTPTQKMKILKNELQYLKEHAYVN